MLEAFASFGFCKAHAAAFALPTYQSAWLKTHYPAHFLAGVLTHDPGMYPKRLILDDARQFGIAVLGLDVNASETDYVVERVGVDDEPPPQVLGRAPRRAAGQAARRPCATASGSRSSDVKGISEAEVRPDRRGPALPLAHRLLAPRAGLPAGAGAAGARRWRSTRLRHRLAGAGVRRRGKVTRRDLLLQVADLDRHTRAVDRAARAGAGALAGRRGRAARRPRPRAADDAAVRNSSDPRASVRRSRQSASGVWAQAPAQSQATRQAAPVTSVQLALDLGDAPVDGEVSGLPEMNAAERVRAELEVLGLDVSRHVVDFYDPVPRRARGDPVGRPAATGAAAPSCWWPGSRSPPRPRRSAPGAGSSSSPSTTPPGRSTRPSSRTPRAPTPPPSSTPGCWWSAGSCAAPGRAGCLAAGHRLLGAARAARGCGRHGGIEAVHELMAAVPEGFGARRRRGGRARCGREPLEPGR